MLSKRIEIIPIIDIILSNMKKLIFKTPEEYTLEVANRIRKARKILKLSRKKLSLLSGIPEPTIRRFEDTGEIAFKSLVGILAAMNYNDDIDHICHDMPYRNIEDIQ